VHAAGPGSDRDIYSSKGTKTSMEVMYMAKAPKLGGYGGSAASFCKRGCQNRDMEVVAMWHLARLCIRGSLQLIG
jgi:hypothetical protein